MSSFMPIDPFWNNSSCPEITSVIWSIWDQIFHIYINTASLRRLASHHVIKDFKDKPHLLFIIYKEDINIIRVHHWSVASQCFMHWNGMKRQGKITMLTLGNCLNNTTYQLHVHFRTVSWLTLSYCVRNGNIPAISRQPVQIRIYLSQPSDWQHESHFMTSGLLIHNQSGMLFPQDPQQSAFTTTIWFWGPIPPLDISPEKISEWVKVHWLFSKQY